MTTEALKSTQITNLDATPITRNTTGQNGAGILRVIDGYCAVTATGIAAAGSTYQLVRIPTSAVIKKVTIGTDVAIDSNATQTLVLDFNLAFSDASNDGTPASKQAKIPTTATPPAETTVASYSSPNKIFGSKTLSGNDLAIPLTDITFQNSAYAVLTNKRAWDALGYTSDPGGFFDLLAYVSTGAATGHAGNLYASVEYVD